jgi:ParB family chromosome partitioning protein
MGKFFSNMTEKTAGIAPTGKERPTGEPKTVTAMAVSSNKLRERAEEAEAEAERLRAELAAGNREGGTARLPLDQLHEVPSRRRKMTSEQYNELKENLRNNPLVTPITVRKRPKGGYEVVSGNNRVAIYRELERNDILAVVVESDDDQADLNAFYANLLQTDLSDYEKYLGFKMIQAKYPDMTHTQIAERAGKSRQFVTQLMAFADLPVGAIAILSEKPFTLGANAAEDMAILNKKGRGEQVTEAVIKLCAGEFDQAQAVKYAAGESPKKAAAAKAEPIRFKVGKSTYCDFRRSNNVVRIDFKSPEEAEAIEAAIRSVIENRVEQLKGK